MSIFWEQCLIGGYGIGLPGTDGDYGAGHMSVIQGTVGTITIEAPVGGDGLANGFFQWVVDLESLAPNLDYAFGNEPYQEAPGIAGTAAWDNTPAEIPVPAPSVLAALLLGIAAMAGVHRLRAPQGQDHAPA